MENSKKFSVIIAAAGLGTRMGSGIPKQFLRIDGKPMVAIAASRFIGFPEICEIIVVTGKDQIASCKAMLEAAGIDAAVIEGGTQRQDSIRQGLLKVSPEAEFVLIHDAARPFVSRELVQAVMTAAVDQKAVVCAVPVTDTVRRRNRTGNTETLPREELFAVQTPQAFAKELIVSAYRKASQDGYYGTDDAVLLERMGMPMHIIAGEYTNKKITTKGDLPMEMTVRTGIGYDVHCFAEGRDMVLGGVNIPHAKGLLGHSDADVLLHAVMDALLGASGGGDLGRHFPDTDPKFASISSLALLAKVGEMLKRKGYQISNIDATYIGEEPKISPYAAEMRRRMGEALSIPEERINIKGTTTEKLGFTGRQEGAAAEAVCTLCRSCNTIEENIIEGEVE